MQNLGLKQHSRFLAGCLYNLANSRGFPGTHQLIMAFSKRTTVSSLTSTYDGQKQRATMEKAVRAFCRQMTEERLRQSTAPWARMRPPSWNARDASFLGLCTRKREYVRRRLWLVFRKATGERGPCTTFWPRPRFLLLIISQGWLEGRFLPVHRNRKWESSWLVARLLDLAISSISVLNVITLNLDDQSAADTLQLSS